ncbi:hypothetical protein ASG67_14395 [Sphingomonas sp. Leaf339]|nr:hypothetical protein ASG67_14395 [Sphingomonas sp. Leaf339]
MQDGRVEDGIDAYRSLSVAEPGDAETWYNLAYLLRCARRFGEAVDAYGQALARGISRPEEVHLNRAVILSEFLQRPDEAEAELRTAIGIKLAFTPALLNLGNLLEDRGEAVEARAVYGDVLAIEPRNGRALARQAAIDVFEGRGSVAVTRLRDVLAEGRLSPDAVAEVGFALGNALDSQGDYKAAFAAFEQANLAARAVAHPASRYDRATFEALIDRLIAMPPVPKPTHPPMGPSPIFICGMFRSGSTLVEQILSRHSRVTGGGELDIVPALAAAMQPYPEAVSALTPDGIRHLRDRYLAEAHLLHPQADILTDKRPDNFLHIGLIKRIFPEARIVHTTRAPLDNILSIYFLHFDDSVAYGHKLGDIAHWFGQYRRLMAHWRALYGDDIFDVAYDEVVHAPESSIAGLLDFCGLPWEDAVLTQGVDQRLVRTASVWQVRQPLHQRSSGRWRNYAGPLAPFHAELGEFAPDD